MPIHGVHHIAVIASDYERSRRFYHELLGLPIIRELYRAQRRSHKCDLTIPGSSTQLELFSFPDAPPRPTYPEARGLRHLAFAVHDLDAELARLAAAGVYAEPVRIDETTSLRFTFIADPDGLPIELYETRPDR